MKTGIWRLLASFVVCAALSQAASAQSVGAVNAQIDSLLKVDHAGFLAAFKMLQANIADGSKMAQEYEYPVTITVDGKERIFAAYEDFLAAYAQIVTPAVIKVVKLQKYKDLKVSNKGVTFGSGQLRVNAFCVDGEACTGISWEISAVNH
ncbi:MAG: hypothetical protein ABJB10_02625 [Mesorhizobium sp.]